MALQKTCPWCRGRGTNRAEYGPVMCPDCDGNGYMWECGYCGTWHGSEHAAELCELRDVAECGDAVADANFARRSVVPGPEGA